MPKSMFSNAAKPCPHGGELGETAVNLAQITMFYYMPNIPVENKFALRLFAQLIEQMCNDYILYRLGAGDFFGNVAEGGFWGLWDNRSLNFSRELMDCFRIPEALLPRMRRTGEPVGTISAEAAEKSGLGPDVLLCVGAGDQNSAALGAGVVSPGSVSISLGTGGLATVVLDGCYRAPNGQAMVTSHACQGLWTFEGLQNAAAGVFRWFRDEIAALEKTQAAASGTSAYDRLNEMIAQTPVGARGLLLLPQFAGSAAPPVERIRPRRISGTYAFPYPGRYGPGLY